jgi:predicted RNase H-like HicB family nuclease
MNQYSLFLQWSEEDQLFLVTIPEFSDDLRSVVDHRVIMPYTYGKTREKAIHNGEEVIEMYLEAWEAEAETIPQPHTM